MAIMRSLGRLALSGIFIKGGFDAFRQPGHRTELVAKAGIPEPTTAVRLNGAVMMLGGLLLALGTARRLAALALIGSIIPTTVVGHAFWQAEGQTRQQQSIQFLKNLGLLGGLLMVLGR